MKKIRHKALRYRPASWWRIQASIGLLGAALFLSSAFLPAGWGKHVISRKHRVAPEGIFDSEFSIRPIYGPAFWHNSPTFTKPIGRQLCGENADHSLVIIGIPKKRSWHFLWFWREETLKDAAYFEGIGNINLFSFLNKTQPELEVRADAAISAYKQALQFQPQYRSVLLSRIDQAYALSGREPEAI